MTEQSSQQVPDRDAELPARRLTDAAPERRLEMPRGRQLSISIDGEPCVAYAGESVAAVLFANGVRSCRTSQRRGQSRGFFCGMGVCFECLVQVNGRPNVRACQTPVCDGMRIARQCGPGQWEAQ